MRRELEHELDEYRSRYLAHHTHRKNRALHDLGDLAVIAGSLTFDPVAAMAGVAADDAGLVDGGDEGEAAGASLGGAREAVDVETPAEELGPGVFA